MKRLLNVWLLLAMLTFGLAACSEDATEDVVQEVAAPTITAEGVPAGGLSFLYSDTEAKTFTLTVDAPWEIEKDGGWFVVSPRTGKAGTHTISVSTAYNTEAARTGKMTITANSGTNLKPVTATCEVEVSQAAYMSDVQEDAHQVGYVFFQDDFNWITPLWIYPDSKYGWVTVKVDGTNNNEYAFSVEGAEATKAKADEIGYTYNGNVYVHYEGCLKFGNASTVGLLTTPKFSGIEAGKSATLLVSFYAATYASPTGNVDGGLGGMIPVKVLGSGTIDGAEEASIPVPNIWSWKKYYFVVTGATSETQIQIGNGESIANGRFFLDEIVVARAASGATAPAAEDVPEPETEFEFALHGGQDALFDGEMIVAEGGDVMYTIRVNKGFTIETDCDWLVLNKLDTKAGGTNGAPVDKDTNVVTANPLGIPWNNSKLTVKANDTTQARQGKVTVKVDGVVLFEQPVGQKGAASDAAKIEIGGLTDNAIAFAADATAAVEFTVKANKDWTLTGAADWFTVAPTEGKADETVTVKVTPTANTAGSRSAELTITAGEATAAVKVSQEAGVAAPEVEGMPATWEFGESTLDRNTATFHDVGYVNKDMDHYIASEKGDARLTYVFATENSSQSYEVGTTGHPYIKGAWEGDYWLFDCKVKNLPANTKVHFSGRSRISATGLKYWAMEYNDGGTWKPVSELKTAEDGNKCQYTHALTTETSNTIIDVTVTFENAIADGNLQFRMRCVGNVNGNGKVVDAPAGGTCRWAGKVGDGTSPFIEVVN